MIVLIRAIYTVLPLHLCEVDLLYVPCLWSWDPDHESCVSVDLCDGSSVHPGHCNWAEMHKVMWLCRSEGQAGSLVPWLCVEVKFAGQHTHTTQDSLENSEHFYWVDYPDQTNQMKWNKTCTYTWITYIKLFTLLVVVVILICWLSH